MAGAVLEQQPVRAQVEEPTGEDVTGAHGDAQGRSATGGIALHERDLGPLGPGPVGHLRVPLPPLLGQPLTFQVLEEPLPPHTSDSIHILG